MGRHGRDNKEGADCVYQAKKINKPSLYDLRY